MSNDDPDLDLTRRLTVLADRAPYPPKGSAHDAARDAALDLARGRRRMRQRRATAGAGVVGAVAAATVVLALVPGGMVPSVVSDPEPAGQGSSPRIALDGDAGEAGDTGDTATERVLAPGESLDTITSADLLAQAAEGYARVLAERLDPTSQYAVLPTENVQSSGSVGSGDGPAYLGTRMGWQEPGEPGRGAVSVVVGRSMAVLADAMQWSCSDPGWTCADLTPPAGTVSARQATYSDGVAVVVRRTDGVVVSVSTQALDANNSLVAVRAVDLTVDQLLDAATDPRLMLPEADADRGSSGVLPVPSIEDRLAIDATVERVGREVLLSDARRVERLAGGPVPGGHQFGHAWRWVGQGGEGVVGWSVDGSPSVAVSGTCTRSYKRCLVHTEDDREVFIGYRRDGRGWSVWAPGPQRTVRVSFDGTGYPVERALALALDPRLQGMAP